MAEQDPPAVASAAVPETNEARLERRAQASELIFVGTVESVGVPPSSWSGYFASHQEVCYRVEETVKGVLADPQVVMTHLVVKNSPTAEPGEVPGLSSQLFVSGARLLVMGVKVKDGGWSSPSERFGVMPCSVELLEQVRAIDARDAAPIGPPLA